MIVRKNIYRFIWLIINCVFCMFWLWIPYFEFLSFRFMIELERLHSRLNAFIKTIWTRTLNLLWHLWNKSDWSHVVEDVVARSSTFTGGFRLRPTTRASFSSPTVGLIGVVEVRLLKTHKKFFYESLCYVVLYKWKCSHIPVL